MGDIGSIATSVGAGLLSDMRDAIGELDASITPDGRALILRCLERASEVGAKALLGQPVPDFDLAQVKFQKSGLSDAAGQVIAATVNATLMKRGKQLIQIAAALGGVPLPAGLL